MSDYIPYLVVFVYDNGVCASITKAVVYTDNVELIPRLINKKFAKDSDSTTRIKGIREIGKNEVW